MNGISEIVKEVMAQYDKCEVIGSIDRPRQPSKAAIIEIIDSLQKIIFPGYFEAKRLTSEFIEYYVGEQLENVKYNLEKQMVYALRCCKEAGNLPDEKRQELAKQKTAAFLTTIPRIQEYLDTDVKATFDGDPAAYSYDEIIYSYPGIYAIMVSRIAHELYELDVPLIPRIMTEHAHSLTGIDINPGAKIGKYFCIDHGTGIVVGETTVIGEHVKMYQGVTLGGLSTAAGQKLQGKKRHPTIEDNVTIYSGASILGGETVIGEGTVIGGNVFVTSSVEANTRVTVKNQELRFTARKKGSKKTEE